MVISSSPNVSPAAISLVQSIEERIELPQGSNLDERQKYETLRQQIIENDGTKDYYDLRKGWSIFISFILFLSIAFQITVIMLVGFKVIDFMDNQLLINLVMGENFLQIIGLVYVIINFLYPKKITPQMP